MESMVGMDGMDGTSGSHGEYGWHGWYVYVWSSMECTSLASTRRGKVRRMVKMRPNACQRKRSLMMSETRRVRVSSSYLDSKNTSWWRCRWAVNRGRVVGLRVRRVLAYLTGRGVPNDRCAALTRFRQPLTKRVAGPHRMRPQAGPIVTCPDTGYNSLEQLPGTTAWVPATTQISE